MDRVARVDAGGSSLAYKRFGTGAPLVVLLHGWMMSGAVWDRTLASLDPTRATYLVPDLRGVAAWTDDAERLDLAGHARDVWGTVLAAAGGDARPVLVGHSMGGQIAQLVAADHPEVVAGLVLLNSVPASGLPLPADALALFAASAGDATRQGAILDMATNELPPDARAELLSIAGSVPPEAIRRMLDLWRAGGFEARLADVRAPTLVVSTDDPFLPPELLDATITTKIGGARREHLTGPGHYPLVERPAETAALIERFLATL
ncbi:MAG: alpha/beta hydrolase [Myxococcales bacterium]|nr:alpha/beta hydrolase [Myxococcales bacterium]MCB9627726.1 alpha/beta hydrolase [Sandaracinaceae bacterium]